MTEIQPNAKNIDSLAAFHFLSDSVTLSGLKTEFPIDHSHLREVRFLVLLIGFTTGLGLRITLMHRITLVHASTGKCDLLMRVYLCARTYAVLHR